MTFKPGEEHFKTKELAEAKAKVLDLVGNGATTHQAMSMVGKKPATIRQWILRDSEFAKALAEAKERGEEATLSSLGVEKQNLEFAEFSKIFLGQTVFPHHQEIGRAHV